MKNCKKCGSVLRYEWEFVKGLCETCIITIEFEQEQKELKERKNKNLEDSSFHE